MTNTPDTATLADLLAQVTPGPWEATRGFVRAVTQNTGAMGDFTVTVGARWVAECARGEGFDNGDANAALIALAPALAAEVLALREERDAAKRSSAVEIARRAARSRGVSDEL
jgi:hypothetical protein